MTATRVRRTRRHHRCARCGFEATYENAGAKEARSWFNRHSCRKREIQALRAVQSELREALVDRTPKPCLHARANHQHGTRACYVLDRCRCTPCTKANSAAENERTRLKAYGRYHKYVSAEHVRAHLAELAEYGIGLKRVSELSGVSNGSLSKIVFGTYASIEGPSRGRYGKGELLRGPARRVLRSTAERIYAVEAIPANLGARRPDHERTPTARLHLRALVALGWSQSKLAGRIGWTSANFCRMLADTAPMARETVDKIEALYAELCMTLPPATNQRERISVSRAKRYARERGWLPPLALEDVDDVAAEGPDLDEAAILRRLDGDRSVRLTKDEAAEVVRRWLASGRSGSDCERTTGLKVDRYFRREDVAS